MAINVIGHENRERAKNPSTLRTWIAGYRKDPIRLPDPRNRNASSNKRSPSPRSHQHSRDLRDPTLTRKDKAREAPTRIVTEEEVHEFLKMIHHNEYEILDQLHKTLARISFLLLLINLEGHHELLFKVLNDAHKFGGIINNISTSRYLSFSEDEIPAEGRSHNQPLHITIKCGNYKIARVLIENGSSLNVMPKATLDMLHSVGATLKNSPVVVRAFDESKQEVMGEISLLVRIGSTTFDITFQVIDIQVKFIVDQQIIRITGEKELIINTPLLVKYIEGDEEALETSFQALEIVGTTSAKMRGGDPSHPWL
ncbi:hypothetical protein CR513_08501, partial [Mucuna pruriens]